MCNSCAVDSWWDLCTFMCPLCILLFMQLHRHPVSSGASSFMLPFPPKKTVLVFTQMLPRTELAMPLNKVVCSQTTLKISTSMELLLLRGCEYNVPQINFGPVSCCTSPRLLISEVRSHSALTGQRLGGGNIPNIQMCVLTWWLKVTA